MKILALLVFASTLAQADPVDPILSRNRIREKEGQKREIRYSCDDPECERISFWLLALEGGRSAIATGVPRERVMRSRTRSGEFWSESSATHALWREYPD